MRVFFWGIVVIALAYAAYAGMMSAWSWLQVANVVDEAIQPRNATDALAVKSFIVKGAAEAGVPVTERDVSVTFSDRSLQVRVAWTFPVVSYHDDTVLAVPLSVKRTADRAIVAR